MSTPDKHTPAYKIFHYYIPCQIPAAFAYEKQNALVGTVQYETPEQEAVAAEEMVHRQHTVAELAELCDRGARIILSDPKDAAKVYEWVNDHVKSKQQQNRGINDRRALPMQDLRKLDNFASYVFRVARQFEGRTDIRQNHMARKMDELFGRRRLRLAEIKKRAEEDRRPRIGAGPIDQPEPAKLREHESVLDDINREAIERDLPMK